MARSKLERCVGDASSSDRSISTAETSSETEEREVLPHCKTTNTRTSISHAQRLDLRDHFHETSPKPTHAALRAWFRTEYGRDISQSIVSRILSDVPADRNISYRSTSGYRARDCQWPWLELQLGHWLHEAKSHSRRVTNDTIAQKARELWEQSEMTDDAITPRFSVGWVVKFRKRHDLRLKTTSYDQGDTISTKTQLHSNSRTRKLIQSSTHLQQSRRTCADHKRFTSMTHATCSNCKPSSTIEITLSSDHLLHLIQHNTFRAVMTNKRILIPNTSTQRIHNLTSLPIKQFPTRICDGLSLIHAVSSKQIPSSLYPTRLQSDCAHSSVVNLFPCQRLRDNLILRGEAFVPEEFCEDLFGEVMRAFEVPSMACWQGESTGLDDLAGSVGEQRGQSQRLGRGEDEDEDEDADREGDEDDYTAAETGLIVWGDPWVIQNWEVTPRLLRKWRWAFEGCDELIRATNRWRVNRFEEVLVL